MISSSYQLHCDIYTHLHVYLSFFAEFQNNILFALMFPPDNLTSFQELYLFSLKLTSLQEDKLFNLDAV